LNIVNNHGKRLMRTLGDRHKIHTRHISNVIDLAVSQFLMTQTSGKRDQYISNLVKVKYGAYPYP